MLTTLFRCDASREIGFGHVMRCLALAECLREHGDAVRFLIRQDEGASRVLREMGRMIRWLPPACAVSDIAQMIHREVQQLLSATGEPPWVVVDSDDEPRRQIEAAREAGALVLMVDDLGGCDPHAHLLVNPNLDAMASWYPGANGTTLLLGSGYHLLRREFLAASPRRVAAAPVRRILVTLGGSDAKNRTALVLQGLDHLPSAIRGAIEVHVVLGPGCLHRASLEALIGRVGYRALIHRDVLLMSALLREADLAITAGGGTLYEAAACGLPALVIVLSENQQRNASAFARRGVAVPLGDGARLDPPAIARAVHALMEDADRREAMSRQARGLIDGHGPERIRQAMLERMSAVIRRGGRAR